MPRHRDAFLAQGLTAGAPAFLLRERRRQDGGLCEKKDGVKSALRVRKFVVFCARRSAPSVSEPESELLSLLDS